MIIFTILLLVIGVVSFAFLTISGRAARKKGEANSDNYMIRVGTKMLTVRNIIAIAVAVLLVLSCAISGFRIIDSTEVGVVRTFGRIDHVIDDGPNFVNPLTDSVDKYDLRVHVRQEEFMTYTKDAQPASAAVEYQFSLRPERILDIAKEYGSQEILESKLGNVVEEKAKVVFSRYSAMTLLEHRSTLSAEIEAEMPELEERYGIEFTSVIIQNIDFSDAFEASVEAKMTAEQKALTAEQEKKAALIKAEEKREIAKIDAEAEVAKAEGEAEALRITREALQNMPETWVAQQYLEKWDGKLPQIMSDDTGLMINPAIN